MTKEIKNKKVEVKEKELRKASGGVTPIRPKRPPTFKKVRRPVGGPIAPDQRRK